jgi:hypothetical protein
MPRIHSTIARGADLSKLSESALAETNLHRFGTVRWKIFVFNLFSKHQVSVVEAEVHIAQCGNAYRDALRLDPEGDRKYGPHLI